MQITNGFNPKYRDQIITALSRNERYVRETLVGPTLDLLRREQRVQVVVRGALDKAVVQILVEEFAEKNPAHNIDVLIIIVGEGPGSGPSYDYRDNLPGFDLPMLEIGLDELHPTSGPTHITAVHDQPIIVGTPVVETFRRNCPSCKSGVVFTARMIVSQVEARKEVETVYGVRCPSCQTLIQLSYDEVPRRRMEELQRRRRRRGPAH